MVKLNEYRNVKCYALIGESWSRQKKLSTNNLASCAVRHYNYFFATPPAVRDISRMYSTLTRRDEKLNPLNDDGIPLKALYLEITTLFLLSTYGTSRCQIYCLYELGYSRLPIETFFQTTKPRQWRQMRKSSFLT